VTLGIITALAGLIFFRLKNTDGSSLIVVEATVKDSPQVTAVPV
jgi:hypothetical protein